MKPSFSLGLFWTALIPGFLVALPSSGGARGVQQAPARSHGMRGELSPDGTWAVYSAEDAASGERNLYSVPLAGGEPVRLGGPLSSPLGEQWALSPDGRRVVYLAGALLSVPLDGREASVRLDAPESGPVLDFVLGDGGRVVYRAGGAGQYAGLFSAPLDGRGGASVLVAPNALGEVGRPYTLAAGGGFVLFPSHHEDGRMARLYSVPADGGAPVCLGPRDLPLQDFRLAPDGARVAYRLATGKRNAFELFSARLDGGEVPLALGGALASREVQAFEFSPDGARVVYLAGAEDGRNTLSCVAAEASAPPVELARGVASGFRLHPGGRLVLYAAESGPDGRLALFGASLDGAAGPLELAARPDASVGWFDVTPDGARVVYRLDRAGAAPGSELWTVSLSTEPIRTRLADVEGARDCRLSPDGRRVVYVGAGETLFALALEGGAPPVALASGVDGFRVSPDGARVLCSSSSDDGAGAALLSVPLDRSSSALRLAESGSGLPPGGEAVQGTRSHAPRAGDPPDQGQGAGGTTGFRDFSFGFTGTSTPTGEKPESKLWWADGSWWGALYVDAAQQHHIHRLDFARQTWEDTGTVLDVRRSSKGDVLWDGANQKLYFASHIFTTNAQPTPDNWGRLFRYSYSPGLGYLADEGFPVDITRGNCEALTIAKDSLGVLWATWAEASRVMINHSTNGDGAWGLPVVLPVDPVATTLTSDDISAVVAFGTNVGVMWSNQLTATTYFGVHRDGDPDTVWQTEVILPDLHCTGACSDDLFSLKSDRAGNVGAALKTSLTGPDEPLIMAAVRTPSGTWQTAVFGRVQDHHTRPILLFDDDHDRAFVFATHPENGGAIYFKSTTPSALAFEPGLGTPFIQNSTDVTINNATSTKQNLDSMTDILVLASDQNTRFYVHNYLSLPPTITNFVPTRGPEGTPVILTGGGLNRVTSVTFNGVPAEFTILSRTRVRATVPAGALSGRITVTTPIGSAMSQTMFSVDDLPSDAEVEIWPPNGKLVDIDLSKLVDFDAHTLAVYLISQDEPSGDTDAGDGCDAEGVGTCIARLRAKRDAGGNGRVYRVHYRVAGSSSGFVTVVVPHDRGSHAEDDGQIVDSCEGCAP